MAGWVLDASALLAYLRDEPGAEVVADAVADGATIGTVNLAEVLGRAADRGAEPGQLADELRRRGLIGGAVAVEPLTAEDAIEIAQLRSSTRRAGLSLGDRACLALARRLGATAVTSDRAWLGLEVDVELRVIR